MKIQVKHKPCTCDDCMYYWYKTPCRGCGHHNSFWATVIESREWKLWAEEQMKRLTRDMAECEELGRISPEHFQEFIQFVKESS